MAETVNVPVVGPEPKKTVLIFGGAAVAVIGYAVYKKQQASKAAAAAAAASSTTGSAQFTDPAGNQCAAPDASTGYCPGTPEDISAQEQLSGSGSYGMTNSTYGTSLGGGSLSNASNTVPVFTNNGSWGTYVEQMLGSNGSDAIAAAIAKYLSGQSMTSDQATVAEEAIAIANYPPVSGPGGFPPSMNTTATSSVTPGTCPSGYTFSSAATGATGELAATGGAGWCQPPAVAATPSPAPTSAGSFYAEWAIPTGKGTDTDYSFAFPSYSAYQQFAGPANQVGQGGNGNPTPAQAAAYTSKILALVRQYGGTVTSNVPGQPVL